MEHDSNEEHAYSNEESEDGDRQAREEVKPRPLAKVHAVREAKLLNFRMDFKKTLNMLRVSVLVRSKLTGNSFQHSS